MTIESNASQIRDDNLFEHITCINPANDSDTYPIGKLEAHEKNLLHLAISIFIFHKGKLLVQQRAVTKYHSGGLWANTVCSHPRWLESPADCAQRRLNEELGWQVPLTEFGCISYAAKVGELYENEKVHCFIGEYSNEHNVENFNRDEVSAVDWLSLDELDADINRHPEIYTAWLKIYMAKHRALIATVQSELREA